MCGRTACSLSPSALCSACGYESKVSKKITQPKWIPSPDGHEYKQSYNISPSCYSPVLFSGELLEVKEEERVIQPMRWGLVPSSFRRDVKEFNYCTNNARFEGILNKQIYSNSLMKGYRCIVLVEGFYEWENTNTTQIPYFISQKDKPVMMLAGLFDIVPARSDKPPLFSYTVITKESIGPLKRIHNRMPAILSSKEEVDFWLNSSEIPADKALLFLRSHEDIQIYRVSTFVNNSKNDSKECIAPFIDNSYSNIFNKWLKRPLKDEQSSNQLDPKDDQNDIPDKKSKP